MYKIITFGSVKKAYEFFGFRVREYGVYLKSKKPFKCAVRKSHMMMTICTIVIFSLCAAVKSVHSRTRRTRMFENVKLAPIYWSLLFLGAREFRRRIV